MNHYNIKLSATLQVEGSSFTPQQLLHIAQIAEQYHIEQIKLTSNRQLTLVGIIPDKLPALQQALGITLMIIQPKSRYHVQFCPGLNGCARGQMDAPTLGRNLQERLSPFSFPGKTKIAISGCPSNCSAGMVRDIGIFGQAATGWTITIGGNAGLHARVGDVLAQHLTETELYDLIERLLVYYHQHGLEKERLHQFIPRIGLAKIKEELLT